MNYYLCPCSDTSNHYNITCYDWFMSFSDVQSMTVYDMGGEPWVWMGRRD